MTSVYLAFDRAAVRERPLPVAWDGRRVDWEWQDTPTPRVKVWLCPPPTYVEACDRCGSRDDAEVAVGLRHPLPGETILVDELHTTRTGKTYIKQATVPAWPVRNLWAWRCTWCKQDTVHDLQTNTTWTLDPTDYTPKGSTHDNP